MINWGYWGEVGAVADPDTAARMQALGLRPISTSEGIEAVERVLAHQRTQVIACWAEPALIEQLGLVTRASDGASDGSLDDGSRMQLDALREQAAMVDAVVELGIRRLGAVLGEAGVSGAGERASRDVLLDQLAPTAGYRELAVWAIDAALEAGAMTMQHEQLAEQRRRVLAEHPSAANVLELVERCVDAFPAVIRGQRDPVGVLFPGGDSSAVAALYRDNVSADFHNAQVAAQVRDHVAELLASGRERVRILELGAGTGGTSGFVIEALAEFGRRVEYTLSDVSRGFVGRLRERFAASPLELRFAVVDMESDADVQAAAGDRGVDLVLASNAVHATRDMVASLTRIAGALRIGGLLVLNEGCRPQPLATLIFGLTPGWWCFEDRHLRLPGGPLLAIESWREVYRRAGFAPPTIFGVPEQSRESWTQAVFVARSVRRSVPATVVPKAVVHAEGPRQPGTGPAQQAGRELNERRDRARRYVAEVLAEVLKCEIESLRYDATFERFGIDSLVSQEINARFEQDVGEVPATLLFEHDTIARLADYFLAERPALFDSTPSEPAPEPPTPTAAPLTLLPPRGLHHHVAALSDAQVDALLLALTTGAAP